MPASLGFRLPHICLPRAGIDLRSLPYAFIALDRAPAGAVLTDGWSRVIGRPEHFKPYARLLNCDADGLANLELSKRADPKLFKELERTKAPLVYRWQRDGDRILSGERLAAAVGTSREPFVTHSKLNLMTRSYLCDTRRAAALLGARPAVSLAQGLDETVRWLRSEALL